MTAQTAHTEIQPRCQYRTYNGDRDWRVGLAKA